MITTAFVTCSVIVLFILLLCVWALLMFRYASRQAKSHYSGPMQTSPFRRKHTQ